MLKCSVKTAKSYIIWVINWGIKCISYLSVKTNILLGLLWYLAVLLFFILEEKLPCASMLHFLTPNLAFPWPGEAGVYPISDLCVHIRLSHCACTFVYHILFLFHHYVWYSGMMKKNNWNITRGVTWRGIICKVHYKTHIPSIQSQKGTNALQSVQY